MNWKCLSLQAALTVDGQLDSCSVLTLKLASTKYKVQKRWQQWQILKHFKNYFIVRWELNKARNKYCLWSCYVDNLVHAWVRANMNLGKQHFSGFLAILQQE